MTARLKGRRRRAASAVAAWAEEQPAVSGLALVGSYAYDRPRMCSEVDLVLLTDDPARHTGDLGRALAAL